MSISCVGAGRQRLIFKPYAHAFHPKIIPSNETSKLVSSLVHILGIKDIRYDIRVFGGKGITDIPGEIGVDPALDASVSAMLSLYRARQYSDSKVVALSDYGMALRGIMRMIHDPSIQYGIKLKAILVMSICQVREGVPIIDLSPFRVTEMIFHYP